MKSLSEIGEKYGTLKNTHITNGIKLLELYEPFFEEKQFDPITILEIGVLNGASLKTWKEYFPNARIIGFDIDVNAVYSAEERIEIQLGNQGEEVDLRKVIGRGGASFDIIIDDGSHINKYTLRSFNYLWPYLNSGGIYIIEDTICTYDRVDMNWPGMKWNRKNAPVNNNRRDIDAFLLSIIENMDLSDIEGYYTDVFSIHIYRNVIILIKK